MGGALRQQWVRCQISKADVEGGRQGGTGQGSPAGEAGTTWDSRVRVSTANWHKARLVIVTQITHGSACL